MLIKLADDLIRLEAEFRLSSLSNKDDIDEVDVEPLKFIEVDRLKFLSLLSEEFDIMFVYDLDLIIE